MSNFLLDNKKDEFENQQSVEELQREMDTNLTMLKQTSLLDDEFDDWNGTLGGSLIDSSGSKMSPLDMSDILLSPRPPSPENNNNNKHNSSSIEEEKKLINGDFFEKDITVKRDKESIYYTININALLPNIVYETPSGNRIEKNGVHQFLINNKYILSQYPSPSGDILENSEEKLLNLQPGSQKDLLTVDKVLPNVSARKSVAHNIKLMAASKLLSDAQEDESGEWLFTPNILGGGNPTKNQTTFSVPGSKQKETTAEDEFEDDFFQGSPVLFENEMKFDNDERAKKQKVVESKPKIDVPNRPISLTISKSKPKPRKVTDTLRRSDSSLKPKDVVYKPQFFNPVAEIKCKEPSDKKKQQWEKNSNHNNSISNTTAATSNTTTTNTTHMGAPTRKPTFKDTIPTNDTLFPPPPQQTENCSPPRGTIAATIHNSSNLRESIELPTQKQPRAKTPTFGDLKPTTKLTKPHTTTTTTKTNNISKSYTTTTPRPTSALSNNIGSSLPEPQVEFHDEQLGIHHHDQDSYSEHGSISAEESDDEEDLTFDHDLYSIEGDGNQAKNWKLMQWRRENFKERAQPVVQNRISNEFKTSTAPTQSFELSQQSQLDYKPVVSYYSPSPPPESSSPHKPSYEAIVIARDLVLDIIDNSSTKAVEQRSMEQHSIAFFNKVDVTRYADDIMSSSSDQQHSPYRSILNVKLSLFLDKKLTELDWVEEDVPCFVEFYKVFDNDPTSSSLHATSTPSLSTTSHKIIAYYYTFVNIGGDSNLFDRYYELSDSFYYNIDVVQCNRLIPFERAAKYEWKLRENLYLPSPFAHRKQKFEQSASRMNPSLQSTFFSLFHIKDLKGPENEKYIEPYQPQLPQTPLKNTTTNNNDPTNNNNNNSSNNDYDIVAVNLIDSELKSALNMTKHTEKNDSSILHTDDIQLSPIFMPSSPDKQSKQLPTTETTTASNNHHHHQQQNKEPKCCLIM